MPSRKRLSKAYRNYVRERRFWKRRRRYEALKESDDEDAKEAAPTQSKRTLYTPRAHKDSTSESDDQVPDTQDLLMYADSTHSDEPKSTDSERVHLPPEVLTPAELKAQKAKRPKPSSQGDGGGDQERTAGTSYRREQATVSLTQDEWIEPRPSTSGKCVNVKC